MRPTNFILASVLGLLFATPLAAAESAPAAAAKAPQCFFIRNFENWKAADAKTMYIRVNLHQYYRLDLAATCPALLSPGSHLITTWQGSSSVCTALDWDLKVSRGFPGSAEPCIVKTMTPLTSEEVAAIPKKFKP